MLHPVTERLVQAYVLDVWPDSATVITDFGLDSQEHYEAFHHAIRNGELTAERLDEAMMGGGTALTALARSLESNPHKDIQFHTPYDEIG